MREGLTIGWLDFDEQSLRQAKALIQASMQSDTLDELGLGLVRQRFSDLFFPATTTLMRGAKYLLYVPWLCLYLEQRIKQSGDGERELRLLQNQLRVALENHYGDHKKDPNVGIIGIQSGDELHQTPAHIYWRALRLLGLQKNADRDRATYLGDIHKKAVESYSNDEKVVQVEEREHPFWDDDLLELNPFLEKKRLPDTLDLNLSRKDAEYLRQRYLALGAVSTPPSLFNHWLNEGRAPQSKLLWETQNLPEEIQPYVVHAKHFSRIACGLTIHYAYLLARLVAEDSGQNVTENSAGQKKAFLDWSMSAREAIAGWDASTMYGLLERLVQQGHHSNPSKLLNKLRDCLDFVAEWRLFYVESSDTGDFMDNKALFELLREREEFVKGRAARLRYADRRWKGKVGRGEPASISYGGDSFQYKYRADRALQIFNDITAGLGRP